jgi:hypothetical protein
MKIDHINTLKITGNLAVKSALGAIPKGGKVEARVVERLDAGKAVVEIAGKRITAEFLRGVPGDARFDLVLESKRGNQFLFRLAGGGRTERLLAELDPYLLGGAGRLRARLPELKGAFDGPGGLMALNRALAGASGGTGSEHLVYFLNILLKFGIKSERLAVFSYLIGRRKCINSERFSGIAYLLSGGDGAAEAGALLGDEGRLREWIEKFIGDIREFVRDEEAHGPYRAMLESLAEDDAAAGGPYRQYEIPFFDGEKFTRMQVLEDGACVICAVTLSKLGALEIVGREAGGAISLSIFCENDKSVEILKHDLHYLQKALKSGAGAVAVVVRGAPEIRKTAADALRALREDAALDYRA